MTLLSIETLTKRFGGVVALDRLSLTIMAGEIHALIGPSGCGKSTALRLIAGFEQAESGAITMNGRRIDGLKPEARDIGMVFQDYALFPHLTVAENIAFGLHRLDRAAREAAVRDHLALMRLQGLEGRRPDQLSGGQQQRVALARSLAARPRLLLLDEPFSNLDASLRETARREMRDVLRASGMTALFVTHDREEALSLSDRVTVLKAGRVEQTDRPERVYQRPASAFVAGFLGRTNLLQGMAEGGRARTVLGPLPIEPEAHGPVTLSLRPQGLALVAEGGAEATVTDRIYRGQEVTYLLRAADGTALQLDTTDAPATPAVAPGARVRLEAVAPGVVVG
ncbi:iron ABC transporter ATP-binding protein [Rhizobium rhizosphaerae]|uniref:Iron ABC transporter ATP-binding protein n=1 Tax=Xaviernesmea rhizosphaerae TaxID=1672749 RepID=A0ABX3PGX7_9HYPH|nr:ABC transporter ATP-binding protein [Xaviernesmea rhizosphaerae]OQP87325.1 iron ABC transporter ATP-binding protein [Xaviernesmea rhizosphaerae]